LSIKHDYCDARSLRPGGRWASWAVRLKLLGLAVLLMFATGQVKAANQDGSIVEELDSLLDEPIELHCIGGFAIVAAYGLKRSTNDLDYFTLVPCNRVPDLEKLAGEGSPLPVR
jgi:hypothetical protein